MSGTFLEAARAGRHFVNERGVPSYANSTAYIHNKIRINPHVDYEDANNSQTIKFSRYKILNFMSSIMGIICSYTGLHSHDKGR